MKLNKIIIAFLSSVLLVLTFLPAYALAAGELDVLAWADPIYVNEGDQTTIHIEITNNTGQKVTLSAYGVDNEFYQIGEGTTLANGATTVIEHVYFVSFGLNDSISIPVQVNYDGNGGVPVLSFSPQVQINRAVEITTVDFSYTPDDNGIQSGGWINFTIECENTGNVDYKDFTVTAGGSDVETFDLAVGETRTVIFSESYTQDTIQTFGYYFTYMSGGAALSVVQDPVTQMGVTVTKDAVPTQQPIENDAATENNNVPEPLDEPTSKPEDDETTEPEDDETAEQPVLISESDDEVQAAPTVTAKTNTGISTLAVILIAVGAALVSAGVVLTIVLTKRKKAGKPGKRNENVL